MDDGDALGAAAWTQLRNQTVCLSLCAALSCTAMAASRQYITMPTGRNVRMASSS